MKRDELLTRTIEHIDVTSFDARPLLEAFDKMAFQARNLARAAKLYDAMLRDEGCAIILCLAGSLFSAGLRKVVYDLIQHNMVDAIVSSGAIIVDQDFFEALGFKHYEGSPGLEDETLRELGIDRIYDTYISEENLRECDLTIAKIADNMEARPYSSREFIQEMGTFLSGLEPRPESVVLACYQKGVPIFVPAFSDCSAGFGLVYHQQARGDRGRVSIDSARDFAELTQIKIMSEDTGLVMIGGGVPKNFAQDITVAAEVLGERVNMHKYAIQITVADERDGALSGSTLREAHSWGKVDSGRTQMVYAEATIALPLLASYVYHAGGWRDRKSRNYTKVLEEGRV